jgi:hypothetical protein
MSEIRYFGGDSSDLEGMTKDEVRDQTLETYEECEEAYAELLDELYPEVTIGSLTFAPSTIVRECDPIAFRVGVSDYYEEVDLDDFPEGDE